MWAQAWEISCHVAHLYQHYLEYCNIFITFLGRLGPVPPPTRGLALMGSGFQFTTRTGVSCPVDKG